MNDKQKAVQDFFKEAFCIDGDVKLVSPAGFKIDSVFVSTIYRWSSAALNPDGRFYETLAWEWNEVEKKRGKIIADNSGATFSKRARENHFEVVRQLQETGIFKEAEED